MTIDRKKNKLLGFCVLVLLLLFSVGANAQSNVIKTESPIYIASGSSDGKRIAFADRQKIYVVSSDGFSVIYTIEYSFKEKGFVSELWFHPSNNNSLWLRFSRYNDDFSPMPFYEYPDDSMFHYNVSSGEKIFALAGNIHIDFSTSTDEYMVAFNEYFDYEYEGKTVHSARKGGLMQFPREKEYKYGKVVRGLKICPNNKYIAIASYDSLHGGVEYHSLEIRDYASFELIAQKNLIEGKPYNIGFSDDSETLIFNVYDFPISGMQLLRTRDLSEPDVKEIGDIAFRIKDRNLIGLRDNRVVIMNLETGKEENTIWANLTSLRSINGTLLLGDNEIVVFGEENADFDLSIEKGCIEKLNLSNLEIYAKNEDVTGLDSLLAPQKAFFQDNLFNDGQISFNRSKTLMVSVIGRSLQVWNSPEKRKLYDFSFNNDIRAFVNDSSNLLVLEDYEQIGFSDYKIHIIDLKTGVSESRIVKDSEYGDFDPTYKCECFAQPGKSASWICSDFDNALWQISKEKLMAEMLMNFKGSGETNTAGIETIHEIQGSEKIVFRLTRELPGNGNEPNVSLTDSVVMLDLLSLQTKRLVGLERVPGFVPLNPNVFAVAEVKRIKITDHAATRQINSMELQNQIFKHAVADGKKAFFVLEDKNSSELSVAPYDIARNEFGQSFAIDRFSSNYFVDKNGFSFVSDEIIKTMIPENKTNIAWNRSNTGYINSNSLSMDGSGHLLMGQSEYVDMASLQNKTVVPSYTNASLLKGELAGKIVYIREHKYFTKDNSKPYFEILIAPADNYENVLWSSEKFAMTADEITSFDAIEVSPLGNFAFFYNSLSILESERGVFLLNLKTKEIQKFSLAVFDAFAFSADDRFIFIQGKFKNSKNRIYNIYSTETGALVHKLSGGFTSFSSSGEQYLTAGMHGVGLLEFKGDSLRQKEFYYSRDWINVVRQTESGQWICGGSKSGFLYLWQLDKQSPVHKIKCGVSEIIRMEELQGKLYVLLQSGSLKIFDLNTFAEIAEIRFEARDEGNSVSWLTPDGYFMVSRDDLSEFHFVKDGKTYPIMSYEIFLNRPDIIMKRLGYAEEKTVELYHAAFRKRLARHGLQDDFNFSELQRPEILIVAKDNLPVTSAGGMLEFEVRGISPEYKMEELYVTLNGVPVHGIKGLQIARKNEFTEKIHVELGNGSNKIVIKVKDERGVESNPESFEIFSSLETKPHFYYVGIGVSEYLDSTKNLRYAEADVNRLADYFSRRGDSAQTTVRKMLNQEITKENLLGLKKMLLSTGVDDIVVISFSGHGILDEGYNFYFGTHDIDFKDPAKRGFSYNDIEWLLDSIPARRKLLLMDACHSGEVDDSHKTLAAVPMESGVRGIDTRGAEIISDELSTIGLQSSFELMQLLFADLNRNNGAFIISAAGGMEYAFEGEQWGNGVFTYSFINSMYDLRNSGWNQSQGVKISDLRKAIYTSVLSLTGGRQKPTSRTENVEWDWSF